MAIEAAARRMLQDPSAHRAINEFVSEWLRFDRVLNSSRDHRRYPKFNRETAIAMTEEASACLFRTLSGTTGTSWMRSAPAWVCQRRSGVHLWCSRAGSGFRQRGIPAAIGASGPYGAGPVPLVIRQAGRHVPDRPRTLCPRTVSVPARSSAAGRREYEFGALRPRPIRRPTGSA